MLSYNNDKNLKDLMISEMIKHKEQDQFIKGNYSKSDEVFRGCSVGCTIDSVNKILGKSYSYDSHECLEESVGIPEWLARLQDAIFEGIPAEEGADFSIDFLKAIPVGINLEPVKWKFYVFLLNENMERVRTLDVVSEETREKLLKVMLSVLSLYENAIETGVWDKDKAGSLRSEAWEIAFVAVREAESVTCGVSRSVALSARSAEWSVGLSARSAEWSVELAVRSAVWYLELASRSAAWSAAWSTAFASRSAGVPESVEATAVASSAGASVAYKRYAVEIIRLLKDEG